MAVAGRRLEEAKEFANKFNIPEAYGSYEELVKATEVEIVYVNTINPFHYEHSKLALNAGKHVLCEKPLSMNGKQAEEMITLAKQNGLFFMVGFWSRFFPTYTKLREEINGGAIGDPLYLSTHICFDMKFDPSTKNERGLGSVLLLGCYGIQLALWVFKQYPERIHASALMQNNVDDFVAITLYFPGNKIAQINASVAFNRDGSTNIAGTKGEIELHPYVWCPTVIKVNGKEQSFPIPGHNAKDYNYPNSGGFQYQAQSVRECLLVGKTENPSMTHEDSLNVMKIIDEVKQQIGLKYDADK